MKAKKQHFIGVAACLALVGATALGAFAQNTACGKPMTLEQKVQRSLDLSEVQYVASRHEYYHSALDHAGEFRDIWAHETPGVSWTNNTDKYIGEKDLKRFMIDGLPKDKTGLLWVHLLTTPVIEISGDGKTAKGVWISVGSVSGAMGGKPSAQWTDEKYGMDFVKENGHWKIWHLHTFVDYYSPVNGSWVTDNMAAPKAQAPEQGQGGKLQAGVKEEPGVKFDIAEPTERGNYYTGYSLTTVPVMNPKPPEPYCTFSETSSF
jgi:hypothetical protein